jgi:tetratricopeptide (TPR) repeat protein
MTLRAYVFAFLWLLFQIGAEAPGQQPEVPSEAAPPGSEPTPAASPETVDQAVRDAMHDLDRLEAGDLGEEAEAVFKDVTDRIELVRESDPANPLLPYLYGRSYAITGRQGEAVQQLQRFVETREGRREWRAFRLLGDLFVEQYPQLAKANYGKAAALRADEPEVQFGLARCAVKLGRNADAIRLARSAVTLGGPRKIQYLSFLASVLSGTGQRDEAVREAENAMALAQGKTRSHPGVRGHVEALDAQHRLLIEILRAGVTEGEAAVDDYLRLAAAVRARREVLILLSKHDELAIIEAAVEIASPEVPPRLMEQHGVALAEVGRTEEAVIVFEKLLASDPANATATAWLERLRSKTDRP